MNSRLWAVVVLLGAISLLLTGCQGEPLAEAYLVTGETDMIADLEMTEVYDTTEDLQLVVQFNQHTEAIRLETTWIDPDGQRAGDVQIDVPSDAKNVLVRYELEKSQHGYWAPGEWQVKVRVDGSLDATLDFMVEGEIPEDAISPEATEEAGEAGDDGFDVDAPTNPFG